MNIALFIDRFLLSAHQDISDKLQSGVGINNFHLARGMTCVYVLWTISLWFLIHTRQVDYDTVSVVLCVTSDLVFLVTLLRLVKSGEKSTRLSGNARLRNALESSETAMTIRWWTGVSLVLHVIVVLPFMNFEGFIWVGKAVSFTSACYFAACTPKPPSKSDLRKLVEAVGRGLKSLVPKPAEPVPVPA